MQDREALLPFHGTYRGYQWHTRNKIEPCYACIEANTTYMQAYRNRQEKANAYRQGSLDPRPGWFGKRVLPEEEIRRTFEAGESIASIARRYQADRRTINKCLGRGNMRRVKP